MAEAAVKNALYDYIIKFYSLRNYTPRDSYIAHQVCTNSAAFNAAWIGSIRPTSSSRLTRARGKIHSGRGIDWCSRFVESYRGEGCSYINRLHFVTLAKEGIYARITRKRACGARRTGCGISFVSWISAPVDGDFTLLHGKLRVSTPDSVTWPKFPTCPLINFPAIIQRILSGGARTLCPPDGAARADLARW